MSIEYKQGYKVVSINVNSNRPCAKSRYLNGSGGGLYTALAGRKLCGIHDSTTTHQTGVGTCEHIILRGVQVQKC